MDINWWTRLIREQENLTFYLHHTEAWMIFKTVILYSSWTISCLWISRDLVTRLSCWRPISARCEHPLPISAFPVRWTSVICWTYYDIMDILWCGLGCWKIWKLFISILGGKMSVRNNCQFYKLTQTKPFCCILCNHIDDVVWCSDYFGQYPVLNSKQHNFLSFLFPGMMLIYPYRLLLSVK